MAHGERRVSVVGFGASPTTPARVPPMRVLVADERGRRLSAFGLTRWLAQVAPARTRGTVSIALVSDARSRALNKRYRRVDRPTDVLSFPAGANPEPRIRNPKSRVRNPLLGDIVIARGVAYRQAREAGHSELTELRVLALHGLLHLLGYDHDRDNGRMRRLERRLRLQGGLREGLIERVDTE
jgi:probable rRNA maturation factor